MKKLCCIGFKSVVIVSLIVSSVAAIYINRSGSRFDPILETQKLKSSNRRDDALDLATFYRENKTIGANTIAELEKSLEYTTAEKLKSFIWYGAIKGQVCDTPSALGAISTDLCVAGDIRDLSIQGWKYLTDGNDFDKSITLLSVVGICLSAAPHIDGVNALVKNILKYLKTIPTDLNRGLLKKLLTGKISPQHYGKVWELLKKTNGLFPAPHPACRKSTV